jgi:hypothetical protein
VFAALAVSRWIEAQTGWSIRKFVRTARRYPTIEIPAGAHTITAADPLPSDLHQALETITASADLRTELAQLRFLSPRGRGRGQAPTLGRAFPGTAPVAGEWPGEAQLSVDRDDDPGPPVRSVRVADLRGGPAEDLLEHARSRAAASGATESAAAEWGEPGMVPEFRVERFTY